MTILGCMVPEILSTIDRMFCHFRPFFALLTPYQPKKSKFFKNVKNPRDIIIWHMCTINDNDMMYGSYDMKHDKHNFLSFWTVFGPFTLLTTQKNQNFENLKKTSADIYHQFTQVYKNHDHVLYCSWGMACNWCNCYFSFWFIFCPFTLLTDQKVKILRKWENARRYHNFAVVFQNHYNLLHCSWDMVHDGCIFFTLGHFLPFYPLTAQKIKIWKKWKKHISSFYTSVPKIMIICYRTSSKKVALCDIAKIKKSQIFVLFEIEASYEDFVAHKCFKSCYRYFV